MKINILSLSIAAALASGLIALAALAAGGTGSHGKRPPDLKAKGAISGLYPGGVKQTPVKVRNKYSGTVKLGFIKTKALNAGASCTGANLKVAKKKTKVKIPSRAKRVVKIPIAMVPTAPDACQGARFPLRFKLRGKRR